MVGQSSSRLFTEKDLNWKKTAPNNKNKEKEDFVDNFTLSIFGIYFITFFWFLKLSYQLSKDRKLELEILRLSRFDTIKLPQLPSRVKVIGIECDCFDGYSPKMKAALLEFVSKNALELELGRIVGLLMTDYDLNLDSGKTATLLTATCHYLKKPKGFFLGVYETNSNLAKWWVNSPSPPPLLNE